jgi:hypothetical protein
MQKPSFKTSDDVIPKTATRFLAMLITASIKGCARNNVVVSIINACNRIVIVFLKGLPMNSNEIDLESNNVPLNNENIQVSNPRLRQGFGGQRMTRVLKVFTII